MPAAEHPVSIAINQILRPEGQISGKLSLWIALAATAIYGAVMGSFSANAPERIPQIAYAAIKTPILIAATTTLCVAPFYTLNAALGVADDFRDAIRAIARSQAVAGLVLASLAPFTLLMYASVDQHNIAIAWNLIAFTIAAIAAQRKAAFLYRPLIAKKKVHAILLKTWLLLYGLVGVQMGWMLRPFIGFPGLPTRLFRDDPFTNGYIALIYAILG